MRGSSPRVLCGFSRVLPSKNLNGDGIPVTRIFFSGCASSNLTLSRGPSPWSHWPFMISPKGFAPWPTLARISMVSQHPRGSGRTPLSNHWPQHLLHRFRLRCVTPEISRERSAHPPIAIRAPGSSGFQAPWIGKRIGRIPPPLQMPVASSAACEGEKKEETSFPW